MLQEPLLDEASTPRGLVRGLVSTGYGSLAAAIVLEVGGTLCMRMVDRTEWWRLPAYVLYGAAFSLFPWIVRDVPLAVAYAMWSGVGSALVALACAVVFRDALAWTQWVAIGGIVGCIWLMHVS